jgi:uncharacterized protein with GYD domain
MSAQHTYLMLGTYAPGCSHEISADRSRQMYKLIAGLGGSVLECYGLLGDRDVMLMVELPAPATAMQAAMAMARLTGATFTTYPAVPIADFDRIAEDLETRIASARMEAGE